MPERGPLTFGDPDGYAAEFGDARVDLAISGPGAFKARLTRLNLRHLEICFCHESLPRIAHISLSPDKAFLSLPADTGPLVFNGFLLRNGDVVIDWSDGVITLNPDDAARRIEELVEAALATPTHG